MADQAASSANPETPPEGAPAGGNAAALPASGAALPTAAAGVPAAGADVPPAGAEIPAAGAQDATEAGTPGFGERGRMRRRLRFLRKARELAYRDLGGLVFEMQRLGERRDDLVAAKLVTLGAIDAEVRALEQALGDRRAVTVLREAGIAACPRCAAIHGSEDHFCPSCGLAMGAHADRPIAVAPATPPVATGAPATTGPAGASPATTGLAGTSQAAGLAGAPPASTLPPGAPPTRQPPAGPPAQPAAARPAAAQPPASRQAPPASPAVTTLPAPPSHGSAPDAPVPRAPTPFRPPPRAPAPPPAAADDRPTEIIRPSDPPSGAGT